MWKPLYYLERYFKRILKQVLVTYNRVPIQKVKKRVWLRKDKSKGKTYLLWTVLIQHRTLLRNYPEIFEFSDLKIYEFLQQENRKEIVVF